MCGIAGYIVTNPTRIRPTTLQKIARRLLIEIEPRGRDASGFAYVSLKDKHVYLAKLPVRATEFIGLGGHLLVKPNIQKMPRMMLLHTRAATQGKPSNNKNNHPIYSKASGLCMVHNGWITNDDMLINKYNLDPDAEVDSEIYLKLIEKFHLDNMKANSQDKQMIEPIIKATELVYGSLACAMIQSGRIDTMWIWRATGMLAIAAMDWGWAFASTKQSLLTALLGESSSLDTPKLLVSEPSEGALFEIKSNGNVITNKVKQPSWSTLPSIYDSRVCKTTINGEVTNVRRARIYAGAQYYDSESMESYEYGGHQTSRQKEFPSFSTGNTSTSHFGSKEQTDQSSSRPPNWIPTYKRYQLQEEAAKRKPNKQCYCRVEYVCADCLARHEYFGVDLDALMKGITG